MARLLGVACLWLWAVAILMVPAYAAQEKRPNIVFILVDDQETLMNSIDFMPTVQNQLIKKGTTFKKHYCTGTTTQRPSPPPIGYMPCHCC